MQPGRDIDALVAEHVMGLRPGVDFGEWPQHDWKKDASGEDVHWNNGHCYGPICLRCGHSFCVGCDPDLEEQACRRDPPAYSTDIAAAWQVVERMARRHDLLLHLRDTGVEVGPGVGTWAACFLPRGVEPTVERWIFTSTAPDAIASAALRALGVKVPA